MGMKVLIVDDHEGFRGRLRAMLEAEGVAVIGEASDGSSALEAVCLQEADVILLDVQLPDISGFEVAERLSADGLSAAVILISSREASDYRASLLDARVSGFISKQDLSLQAITEVLASGVAR
jgi:DNA-binding NarL/FixJ family response regulator